MTYTLSPAARSVASFRAGRCFRMILPCLFILLAAAVASAQLQPQPVYDPEGQLRKLEEINRQGRIEREETGSDEDVRGREEWFSFQRRYPYDMIPAGIRASAIREMKEQSARVQVARSKKSGAAFLSSVQWENVGPVNFSGRTKSIAVDPRTPNTLFIGAAAGGAWKTVNGGKVWTTTFDTLSSLAMGAICIDPIDPNIIYAGTGENVASVDVYLGDGIFKSTDAGLTWRNVGLGNVSSFSRIEVNRQHHNIVYAAAARPTSTGGSGAGGFYRSTDFGETWTQIVTGLVFDMSVDPTNGDKIYLAFNNSVRRSTDAGLTFATATTGIDTISRSVRMSIAVAPSEPNRIYMLLARAVTNGQSADVYVSANSGTTWTRKKSFPASFFNNQGWYDNCIAVNPDDANIALIGGIDVYQTLDGGDTWQNTTRSYSGGSTHPDQQTLAYSTSNSDIAYLGNDGGVYTSTDAGASWTKVSTNLPTSQYYALDVDQTKPFRVYGGTQDNGSHGSYGTDGPTPNWVSILGGDGFYVLVDLADPNIIYAENFNGTPLYKIDANNLNSRSRIDGSISQDAMTGDYGYWSTPLAMSPKDKKTLYTGRTGLYRTINRGSSWQKLVPGNAAGDQGKISAIGLSVVDAKKMMIGTVSGDLRYSVNDGVAWAKSTGVPGRYVTDIIYDPTLPERVYVALSGTSNGHVYRSDNSGASFVDISANLPKVPANALVVDPRNINHLFVGTDVGVFVSFDAGNYWFPFNDGLALSPVIDMKLHESSRMLVAATHGRSMFRVNIDGITITPGLLSPLGGEVVNTPGPLVVRWAGFIGPVDIYISLDGGAHYQLIAPGINGNIDTLNLPLSVSTNARIRVVEQGGDKRGAESGDFTLKAPANGTELTAKAFAGEAIEVRHGALWCTVRGSDSLFKLKLPLLNSGVGLKRVNIPGRVRDMAYDSLADIFYMLVTADDYGSPKLYKMDSLGVGLGEVSLPADLTRISGVAMVGLRIALITPGADAQIVQLDTGGTVISRSGHLTGAPDDDRRGLVWDGQVFVQGVIDKNAGVLFQSKLESITGTDPLRIRESTPVVLSPIKKLSFFGLAIDASDSDVNRRTYWATDTNGIFYKFTREGIFTSGVTEPAVAGGAYTASQVAIADVSPNPMRDAATVRFTLRGHHDVTMELYDAAGVRHMVALDGVPMEGGEHTVTLKADGLASGIYYVVLSAGAGQRDLRPVVLVR
ncbi:MAG: hypothetical protein ABIR47_01080 [Candidatus Kapaibacterium sp.]